MYTPSCWPQLTSFLIFLSVKFVTRTPGQNPIFDLPSRSKSTLALIGSKVAGAAHGHTARFELPAIFYSNYESVPGQLLTLVAVYDTALFLFLFLSFFKYIKHRCEPSSKLRPPLPRADRPLLRVRGRTLSVYTDLLTMNIQISLKFHAACGASKVCKITTIWN